MATLHKAGRMHGLDGLRGIGAMMVVLYHLSTNALFPKWGWVSSGHVFVLIFFVLSGLVISFSAAHSRDFHVGEFMRKRFARVWPLHAAILFAMLGFHILLWLRSGLSVQGYFVGDHSLASFGASLLLLHDMGFYADTVWNGPSWSISVEFYTYIVFATALWAFGPRAWVAYAALVALAVVVIGAFGGLSELPYRWRFFYCLLGFFTGALLYVVLSGRQVSGRRDLAMGLTQAGLVAAFILCLQVYTGRPWVLLPLYTLTVLLVVDLALDRGWLPGLLATAPFRFLGAVSYAVYLAHIPLLNVFYRLGDAFGWTGAPMGSPGHLTFLIAYLTVLLAVSWGLYRLIEGPARRWLLKRPSRPEGTPPLRTPG